MIAHKARAPGTSILLLGFDTPAVSSLCIRRRPNDSLSLRFVMLIVWATCAHAADNTDRDCGSQPRDNSKCLELGRKNGRDTDCCTNPENARQTGGCADGFRFVHKGRCGGNGARTVCCYAPSPPPLPPPPPSPPPPPPSPPPPCSCNRGTYAVLCYDRCPVGNSCNCPDCATCPAGEYRIACGGRSAGLCVGCAPDTYKEGKGYWHSTCTACSECPTSGDGSRASLVGCSATSKGECVPIAFAQPACAGLTARSCTTW